MSQMKYYRIQSDSIRKQTYSVTFKCKYKTLESSKNSKVSGKPEWQQEKMSYEKKERQEKL